METQGAPRSEQFLKRYRVLEGLLEKRYSGKRLNAGSVVMEYLRDDDSMPVRSDLDLCREIRNLLSHNADGAGEAVVEPSQAALDVLDAIVEYVRRPRLAADFGTPGERIMFAHPNDLVLDLMRRMLRLGYSHVPVRDRTGLLGVLSAESLMRRACAAGFDGLSDRMRVSDLGSAIGLDDGQADKYLFMPPDATLAAVRAAFERHRERNRRLAVVFITEDGTPGTPVTAMLTPWDALRDER